MKIPLFKNEPYTEREAAHYLIEQAAFQPIIREVDGMAISLSAGQLLASYRYLAEAWGWRTKSGWAKDRVSRYLDRLKRHRWITLDTDYYVERDSFATVSGAFYDKRPTLITIIDYSKLQKKEFEESEKEEDNTLTESETASRRAADKPNQNQANERNKIKNHGRERRDKFLFEEFPQVERPEDFINYMPSSWQTYAYRDMAWPIDKVANMADEFWVKYAGKDMEDRVKRQSSLKKRKYWEKVWQAWCNQDFRNKKK